MAHAARVTDPIGHLSRTFSTILGYAGLAVGVAIATAAGGVAIAASAVLSSTGVGAIVAGMLLVMALASASGTVATVADMSQRLGALIDGGELSIEGAIVTGARSVFTGPDIQPQANASAATTVSCHRAQVSQGSETVHVEGHNASRKGDGTSCGGLIVRGCSSVDIGGRRVGDTGRDAGDWLYRTLMTTQKALDDFGTYVPGGTSRVDVILWIWGLVATAMGDEGMKDAGGVTGVGKDARDARERVRLPRR